MSNETSILCQHPKLLPNQQMCLSGVHKNVSIKYACLHAFNYGKTVGWSGRLGWVHAVKFKTMNNMHS